MKKQWISVKCGLSRDPKHRKAMGESVWLFLHMLDRADWESGKVLEWKDEGEAEEMGMPVRTLREHRRKLEELDYISCAQRQYGQEITIHNWTNPREYSGAVTNQKQGDRKAEPSEGVQGDTQGYIQGDRKDVTPTSNSKNQIPLSISNAIAVNLPVTDEMTRTEALRNDAPRQFENALRFSKPLPWDSSKEWREFGEWVCGRYAEDNLAFGKYNIWRNTPYTKGGMSNNRIRGYVKEFYDSWDMFTMATKPEEEKPLRML